MGAAGGQSAELFSDCFTAELTACESDTQTAGMLVGIGLGAAIGAGIDALVWKRTRIFAVPQKGGTVVLSPIAGPRGVGLRVTARF